MFFSMLIASVMIASVADAHVIPEAEKDPTDESRSVVTWGDMGYQNVKYNDDKPGNSIPVVLRQLSRWALRDYTQPPDYYMPYDIRYKYYHHNDKSCIMLGELTHDYRGDHLDDEHACHYGQYNCRYDERDYEHHEHEQIRHEQDNRQHEYGHNNDGYDDKRHRQERPQELQYTRQEHTEPKHSHINSGNHGYTQYDQGQYDYTRYERGQEGYESRHQDQDYNNKNIAQQIISKQTVIV